MLQRLSGTERKWCGGQKQQNRRQRSAPQRLSHLGDTLLRDSNGLFRCFDVGERVRAAASVTAAAGARRRQATQYPHTGQARELDTTPISKLRVPQTHVTGHSQRGTCLARMVDHRDSVSVSVSSFCTPSSMDDCRERCCSAFIRASSSLYDDDASSTAMRADSVAWPNRLIRSVDGTWDDTRLASASADTIALWTTVVTVNRSQHTDRSGCTRQWHGHYNFWTTAF